MNQSDFIKYKLYSGFYFITKTIEFFVYRLEMSLFRALAQVPNLMKLCQIDNEYCNFQK